MNEFKKHRRKLFKKFSIRGIEKTEELKENSITIHTSGVIKELTLKRDSEKYMQNRGYPLFDQDNVGVRVNGINLYNAVNKKTNSHSGVYLVSKNNIFNANGKTTGQSSRGIHYNQTGFEAGTTYSVRLTKMSGDYTDGEVRFYYFESTPDITYKRMFCILGTKKEVVGTFSFTEEEISKGITLGLYFVDKNGETEFNDCNIRADVVKGEYTVSNFPEFEPFTMPKTINIDTGFHGIDGYNDVLRLNWANDTVEATRKVKCVKVVDLIDSRSEIAGEEGWYSMNIIDVPKWQEGTRFYCTHCEPYSDEISVGTLCFELMNHGDFTNLYFYWIGQNTLEDFVSWARENDVRIAYVTEESYEEEIDFSLPKDVFPYNKTACISVENAKIGAIYYDLENY